MSSVISAITRTVPITQFNRGLAGKIFDEVKRTGAKVVIKNNTPEVVIVSTEEYLKEQEELENLRLWKLAMERIDHSDPSQYISLDAFDKKYGFTDEDLMNADEVEFE